jgi:hypothetical protein
MSTCQNPQPTDDAPLLCIVRYADINVKPDSPAVTAVPGGVQVDLTQLLTQNPPSGFGIIFSETTEAICSQLGQVTVPGANPGVQALIQRKVREHYNRFCECPPPPEAPLCSVFGGAGGAGNLYDVTIRFSGTEIAQVEGECTPRGFVSEFTIQLWGPIYGGRQVTQVIGESVCGTTFSHTFFITSCPQFQPCAPSEGVEAFTAGTVTGNFQIVNVVPVFTLFPEICPPLPCDIPPPIGDDPIVPESFEEPDSPPLPLGESAVTTVFVQGEPGDDGKTPVLSQVSRVARGTDITRFQRIAEDDAQVFYDLILEDELESEIVQIPVGACDIVTNEFTSEVVSAVLPIVANSGGYGALFAAIASMVFEVAKATCESKEKPVGDIQGGVVSGVTDFRQIILARATPRPENAIALEAVVVLQGQGFELPSTVSIDTFDADGGEGQFGIAYEWSALGLTNTAFHLLRFGTSYIRSEWDRIDGLRIALPEQTRYDVGFIWRVKPE